MKVEQILPFARKLLTNTVSSGDIVVDATVGNGMDSLFLAQLVGESGQVFGFDIQEAAIHKTKQRLLDNDCASRVQLFLTGHENVREVLPPSARGQVAGAIFNLGYLPGGDKSIVTTPETTIAAIEQLCDLLKKEGIIVLVIYHGHEEGAKERDILLPFLENLDQKQYHVIRYGFINQKNHPPFIVAIEKR